MIERKGGKTIIHFGQIKIITDKINRFRYNELRKKSPLQLHEILKALRSN